jgi:ParB family chromosome partitioning protein
MAARKKAPASAKTRKSAGTRRPRSGGKLAPSARARGLDAAEVIIPSDDAEIATVVALVRSAGGALIGAYRDPLGGRPLVIASVPLHSIQPTPFQRDLSPTHAKRLAEKIDETAAFLDPLIVVRGEDGRLWTPNGRHRLAAAKVLGLKQITALISPDETLAYRILALNTEKARENQYVREFDSPELLTLGLVYERASRFAGGAYSSFLKKVDRFSERTLPLSLREREGFASRLLEIDDQTKHIIDALQKRGFKSPYLRNYVVARINPVRFHKVKKGDTKPPMPLAQALTRMAAAAKKFNVETVSNADLAWVAVGAGAQE